MVVIGIAGLNLFYTCPAVYGENGCFVPSILATIILGELIVNLFLFHYYNKRNQVTFYEQTNYKFAIKVSYWTVKSSSLLVDDEAEQISQFDNIMDENSPLIAENGSLPRSSSNEGSNSSRTGRRAPAPMTNGRLTITEDGIYRREMWVPDDQPKGPTKFCHECRKIIPRRCHHCPLCDMCILRKDHHCMLTGACVGLANQVLFSYFIFAIFIFSDISLFSLFGLVLDRLMAQVTRSAI